MTGQPAGRGERPKGGPRYVSSGYRDAMGFLVIILVLMVKPTGLFARSERIG